MVGSLGSILRLIIGGPGWPWRSADWTCRAVQRIRLWPLFLVSLLSCTEPDPRLDWRPVKVEIVGQPGSYQLLRDGAPYRPIGAGAVAGSLVSLKAHGANSIRTWHVGNGQILDDAHALGLSVSLCLDVGRERLGFDYNDEAAVARQLIRFRAQVDQFKNHPALLTWIIGNELNIGSSNPKVWNAVNEIALMIHEVDPNHPATTALAGLGAKELANPGNIGSKEKVREIL